MTLYNYLANKVPNDAHTLLCKYGKYRKPSSTSELEENLKEFVRTYGDKGLYELASIHPDKELINYTRVDELKVPTESENLNASGGGCGCSHSNASGGFDASHYFNFAGMQQSQLNMLFGISLVIIAIHMIKK
jgi:hypothetical protein|tara:strand:+ start:81 stop:479 length:399 start_codon:yes stop_codon:yes gene_type:complete